MATWNRLAKIGRDLPPHNVDPPPPMRSESAPNGHAGSVTDLLGNAWSGAVEFATQRPVLLIALGAAAGIALGILVKRR
jgi:hypothetical protein